MSFTPQAYTDFPSEADLFYYGTTFSTPEEDLNLLYTPPSKSSLKIGVLVLGLNQVQLLDLAAADLLGMMSRNRMSRFTSEESALEEAVDEIDIRYVSERGEGSFSVTSGARMPLTNSFEDAPQFDIIVIPGSYSRGELLASASAFLTEQTSNPNFIAIMCISSGILTLVQSGVLNQKKATAPSFLLPALRQQFPESLWQETAWTRQDSIWSSSSAVTAIAMMTAFIREYFWDRAEAVECALSAAGIAPLNDYE